MQRGGQLTQILQGREVEFFGQRDGSVATCSPPMMIHKVGDGPGTTYEGACSGEDTRANIRRKVVDDKDFVVGGKSVDAIHIRIDSTFTGMANGTSNEDVWLDAATGMTLRWTEWSRRTQTRPSAMSTTPRTQASFWSRSFRRLS